MSESIRAAERALDVLMCFSINTPVLSMTQITERVGMNKSTVHRLLATLEAKRFVERDAKTGLNRPGKRLLQMAYLTLEKNHIREIAAAYMQRLNELHRETVTLSILDDTERVYLAVDESPQTVKIAARPDQLEASNRSRAALDWPRTDSCRLSPCASMVTTTGNLSTSITQMASGTPNSIL